MKIWLDDERDPENFGHCGWFWVKNLKEFQEAIQEHGSELEEVHLDHYLKTGFLTGLSAFLYLLDNIEKTPKIERVICHSSDRDTFSEYLENWQEGFMDTFELGYQVAQREG